MENNDNDNEIRYGWKIWGKLIVTDKMMTKESLWILLKGNLKDRV